MKKLLIHLVLVGVASVLLALAVLWWLDAYTKHNSELVEIENLEGVLSQKALNKLKDAGLEGVIHDTVFKDGAKKLSVINQNPPAGLKVKKGRKIYLVINTGKVPMVEVPDLAFKTSLSQAHNILSRSHLRVGNVIKRVHPSVRSRTDEPVLAQYEHGTTKDIVPGSLIERNSKVDLVIGISTDFYDNDSTSSGGEPGNGIDELF
jgi:beta-lactam-binding protein with PASTA domain